MGNCVMNARKKLRIKRGLTFDGIHGRLVIQPLPTAEFVTTMYDEGSSNLGD